MGQWHERTTSLLHSIHRAISGAAPDSIPNAEFILDLDDDPQRPIEFKHGKWSNGTTVWGLTRQPNQTHIWLMPDYAYWGWPSALVGSHGELRRKMDEANAEWPWEDKIPKAVWRGTTHLNPDIREPLVNMTQDKDWADVRVCDIYDPKTKAYCIRQHEHCQYRFPIHTEGYTYSGRLKYLQLCDSAPVIHELKWAEHHTHLLRSSGPEQNYIHVKADWSDLEETMLYYLSHDEKAATIATNSHDAFCSEIFDTCCHFMLLAPPHPELGERARLPPAAVQGGSKIGRLRSARCAIRSICHKRREAYASDKLKLRDLVYCMIPAFEGV